MLKAIFIGWRGQPRNVWVSMPDVWPVWFWFNKESREPVAAPKQGDNTENLVVEPYKIQAGKPCWLPDPEKFPTQYKIALKSRQFAKPEFEQQINDWYEQGKSGPEIYNLLMEQKAVLLDPQEEPVEPVKAGG